MDSLGGAGTPGEAGELSGHRLEATSPLGSSTNGQGLKWPKPLRLQPPLRGKRNPAQEHAVILHRARIQERGSYLWSVGNNKIIRLNPAKVDKTKCDKGQNISIKLYKIKEDD